MLHRDAAFQELLLFNRMYAGKVSHFVPLSEAEVVTVND